MGVIYKIVSCINIPRLLSNPSPLITRYLSSLLQPPHTRVVALDTHSAPGWLIPMSTPASAFPECFFLLLPSPQCSTPSLTDLATTVCSCCCPGIPPVLVLTGRIQPLTEMHTKAPDNGANLFIPLHYLMRNIKQLICC